jgi:hypothetical protein
MRSSVSVRARQGLKLPGSPDVADALSQEASIGAVAHSACMRDRAASPNFHAHAHATGSLDSSRAGAPPVRLRRIRDLAGEAGVKASEGSCQAGRGQRRGGLGVRDATTVQGCRWLGGRPTGRGPDLSGAPGRGWTLLGV